MTTDAVPPPDVFARRCPSRTAVEEVGTKWAILVLVALGAESARFNTLRRRIDGISERMLARTLDVLERNGLVSRAVHSTIPPHVSYALTPLGTRLAGPLRSLTDELQSAVPEMVAARSRHDRS